MSIILIVATAPGEVGGVGQAPEADEGLDNIN